MKTCTRCKTEQPLDHFNKRKGEYLHSQCKECQAHYHRQWYALNQEKQRKKSRDRARENPEENRRRVKEWREANPERARNTARNAKAKRKAASQGAEVGEIDFDRVWADQEGRCGICPYPMDKSLTHPDPMWPTIDHIHPLSKGGSHTQDNVQWVHLLCNMHKSAKVRYTL